MSELLPCPFCGCAMSVRSNSIRGEYRPKGDHDNNCAFYGNDLIFPETEHGMRALLSVWNSRAPSQQPAAAPVSGDVALPEPDMSDGITDHYTADQLRTYGQQCSDAALERAAKVCAAYGTTQGNYLAAAIRALKGGAA